MNDERPTILFDRPKLAKLKVLYDKAVKARQEQFVFEGNDLLVSYAKYLIEYLESRIGGTDGRGK